MSVTTDSHARRNSRSEPENQSESVGRSASISARSAIDAESVRRGSKLIETEVGRIRKNTSKALFISSTPLADVDVSFLAEALRTNKSLTSVVLRNCSMTPLATKAIATALGVTPKLKVETLDLAFNAVQGDAATALCQLVRQKGSPIRTLDLGGCRLRPVDLAVLADAVAASPSLQILKVYNNGISGAEISPLAVALEQNHNLTELHAAINHLGDAGAKCVFRSLARNNTLRFLDLGQNSITDLSSAGFWSSLRDKLALTHLDLSNNHIESVGSLDIIESGLTRNNYLKTLVLNSCHLKDNGIATILSAMKFDRSITRLNLAGNQCSEDALIPLAELFQKHKAIRSLDLSRNNIAAFPLSAAMPEEMPLTSLVLCDNPEMIFPSKEVTYGDRSGERTLSHFKGLRTNPSLLAKAKQIIAAHQDKVSRERVAQAFIAGEPEPEARPQVPTLDLRSPILGPERQPSGPLSPDHSALRNVSDLYRNLYPSVESLPVLDQDRSVPILHLAPHSRTQSYAALPAVSPVVREMPARTLSYGVLPPARGAETKYLETKTTSVPTREGPPALYVVRPVTSEADEAPVTSQSYAPSPKAQSPSQPQPVAAPTASSELKELEVHLVSRPNVPIASGQNPARSDSADDQILGCISVALTATVAEVRERVVQELDHVPEKFVFLYKHAPVGKRQEGMKTIDRLLVDGESMPCVRIIVDKN